VSVVKIDGDKYEDVGREFDVTAFPTVLWFERGRFKEEYNGDRTVAALVGFINSRANMQRATDGSLLPEAGRVPLLDRIAHKFVAAMQQDNVDQDQVSLLVDEAAGVVDALGGLDAKWGDYYLRAMRNVQEKGLAFISPEIERLDRLKHQSSIAKGNELERRCNILRVFQPK